VTPNITPASIVGWRTYTDSSYHFKTVIPPSWRIGTSLDDTIPNLDGPCTYEVIFFPPGDTHSVDPNVWMRMNEVMVIFVNLKCPPPDDTPNHLPASTVSVTISGVSMKMYAEDGVDGVKRVAFAHFGGHVYGFYVLGPSADGPLYMGVLKGFAYLGAG